MSGDWIYYLHNNISRYRQAFLLISTYKYGIRNSMKPERKTYNTTLQIDLIKKLKILSAETDKRQNDLLEEAIQDLLKKYEKRMNIKQE